MLPSVPTMMAMYATAALMAGAAASKPISRVLAHKARTRVDLALRHRSSAGSTKACRAASERKR